MSDNNYTVVLQHYRIVEMLLQLMNKERKSLGLPPILKKDTALLKDDSGSIVFAVKDYTE